MTTKMIIDAPNGSSGNFTVAPFMCSRCSAVVLAQFPSGPVPATLDDECPTCRANGAKIAGTLALWSPLKPATDYAGAVAWILSAVLAPDVKTPPGLILKPDEALVLSVLRVFSNPSLAAHWLTGVGRGANGTRAAILQTALAMYRFDDMRKLDGVEIPLQLTL